MKKIKVLLAEDHTIVRKGLRSLLEQDFNITVAGEAGDGHETLKMVDELHPDILVLDISLPLLNGLEITRQLLAKYPKFKILILSMHTSEELIFETINAGARGYVLKNAAPDELVAAIHAVYNGKKYFCKQVAELVIERMVEQGTSKEESTAPPALTKREREITQLVAEGHSSKEIAEMLQVSIKTVENHRANIMKKLKLNSLADLIKYAINKGIIQI